jgi:hypothetical protein
MRSLRRSRREKASRRRNFPFGGLWGGQRYANKYANKQVEAYAVEESGRWIVITVLVKFF